MNVPPFSIRRVRTDDLTEVELAAIRALVDESFDRDDPDEQFSDEDWDHAIGGTHVLVAVDGVLASHAAVVARELHANGRPLRTGYVEAVATLPAFRGRGLGSAAMIEVNEMIRTGSELGALGTGRFAFYERLGWQRWRGPTFVRTTARIQRTADDDGYVFVLTTPGSPADLDLDGPLSCEWRPGDVW